MGGEEFVVVLPATGAAGAIELAERLRTAIEQTHWDLRQVTASFGVSTLGGATTTAAQLIETADKALYNSKHSGRNRVTAYDLEGLLRSQAA